MNFKVEYINKLKITITLILIILISVFAYLFKDVFNYFEEKFIDLRSSLSVDKGLFSQKFKPADDEIIIISVNDLTQYEAARSTELNLRHWPWSREVWAKVINFLEAQNPRVIVVDLNFSNYEDLSRNYSSPDMILADTLGYYDNIVLATALRTPYSETKDIDSAKIFDNFANPYSPSSDSLNMYIEDKNLDKFISYYSHTPIPNIFTNSTTMGVTNLVTTKNKDENIRYSQPVYKLIKGNKEYYIPSLGLATLLKYEKIGKLAEEIPIENGFLKAGKHLIRVNEKGQTLINWHGAGNSYLDIPVNSILLSMVRGTKYFEYDKTKYPLSFFKNKIIIISQTHINTETHNTPVAKEMTDAQIKANIIDNYINDSDLTNKCKRPFAKKITKYKGIILTVCFCAAIVFVILIATNMVLALINGSLIIFIYILLSVLLFAHPRFRLILDMAMPLYFMVSTFLISFVLKVHHEFKKRKKIETIFGNLVSENVLKQLVNKPHRLNLKSTIQKVTVMSCNISNNLQISDELPPEKYVELINNAFNTIEKIIFKYNGTINRFVGNSVLVYWGYPIHSRKDSENAIRAALEIQEKIDEFNETHINNIDWDSIDENDNLKEIPEEIKKYFVNVKIAINTGTALIGQIGSSNVSDFTVLGETVDIIERIEDICCEFNKDIIITENTLEQLDEKIPAEYMGQVRLKNSDKKIKIYELKYSYENTDENNNGGENDSY
ncbi:MAG: adenylate/guanylate cyclase domain-containing protein [Clostridium sp.]|nr:adenylate/guanylate cyclase domain-containing protein [Clostridium sp.]